MKKRLVENLIVQDLKHPVVDRARALPEGWNPLTGSPAETPTIDSIRGNQFRPRDLKPLTHTKSGPNNDLFERVEGLLQRAIVPDNSPSHLAAIISAMVNSLGSDRGHESVTITLLDARGLKSDGVACTADRLVLN